MANRYWDAHTHAQFPAYDADREEVIERARSKNISIVNVGSSLATSECAVRLAEGFESGVYASVGLHPIHASPSFEDSSEGITPAEDFDEEKYRSLVLHPKTVSIGECGLDYFHLPEDVEAAKVRQKEVFLKQVELSSSTGKPLMIHCRDAFFDLIPLLEERRSSLLPDPGIIHFFSGSVEEAKRLLELGFFFTFGGVITFAKNYEELIRFIPMERILSETDAPYVAPAPYRGKRNEPSYVLEVVRKLAEMRGLPEDQVADAIDQNARRIFRLPA